jgi:cell division protein FtsB
VAAARRRAAESAQLAESCTRDARATALRYGALVRRIRIASVWLAAGLMIAPLVARAAGVTMADLAELRTEVDQLASDLEAERTAARDELAALRAERAELERQVRAARTRKATLETLRSEATKRAEKADEDARSWSEPMKAAVAAARAHVEAGLPFATASRLEVLDRLDRDLQAATPDYGRVLERLLRFIEEEHAMGGEVAFTQQRIVLEGEAQIASVLRLGLALLYIRTEDDRVGWAVRDGDAWRIERLEGAPADVVRARFDAAQDNRALGVAPLLLPLVEVGP